MLVTTLAAPLNGSAVPMSLLTALGNLAGNVTATATAASLTQATLDATVPRVAVANGTFAAAFPLHDGPYEIDEDNKDPYDIGREVNDRKTLFEVWGQLNRAFKFQPYDLIRKYFGVQDEMCHPYVRGWQRQ